MVTSIAYLPGNNGPVFVDVYAPKVWILFLLCLLAKVLEAYVTTRLEMVTNVYPGFEDPLSTEESMTEQLEFVPQLARCKYEETTAYFVALFDSLIGSFQVHY